MPIGNVSLTLSLGGISIQSAVTRTADGQIGHEVQLPAGQAGTLTTRTSDTQGAATLADGHTIATGDVVDVYWPGGVRYGVTVGTVSGTSVPLTDSGDGDVYPTQGTAIIIAPVVRVNTDFDGDDVEMIAAWCSRRAHVNFIDGATVSLEAIALVSNEVWWWVSGQDVANPLTGDAVDEVFVSNGSTDAATFRLAVLYDSTPHE